MAATLGEEEGVLAIDGTDMPKDGTESVGVARQYCGQLGKRANCQAAVFAAYLGRGAAALVAEGSLPVRWVTCDEGFSVSPAFLDGVAGLGLGYLAEVARNTHVWTARPAQGGAPSRPVFAAPSQEVGVVADQLPPTAWRPFLLREGVKGPQAILCAVRRVVARRGLFPGPDVWLLLRRNPATDELKCYLSHGPADLTPERLVWLAGLRWPIEQCFRDGKQLFGLGDYEGRSWQGWHRHATLVMLAHFFVVRETLRLKKKHPGLTVPQTCLLVDAILPRTGSPTDRAIAIVGYRRARNAAARRAHAQRRRKYCEYLFRQ